jgi:hypothetical protein
MSGSALLHARYVSESERQTKDVVELGQATREKRKESDGGGREGGCDVTRQRALDVSVNTMQGKTRAKMVQKGGIDDYKDRDGALRTSLRLAAGLEGCAWRMDRGECVCKWAARGRVCVEKGDGLCADQLDQDEDGL